MGTVIVSHGNDANSWAEQFCRRPAWSRASGMPPASGARQVVLVRRMTRDGIVAAIEQAARAAGNGGEVIYSVGHGNAASAGPNAQLGAGPELTITQEILMADADGYYGTPDGPTGRVRLSPEARSINQAFRRIGTALTTAHVARFIFLVCVLGNNADFLRQIKTFWGGTVQVGGYTGYVATSVITVDGDRTYPRVSLYLSSDNQGADVMGRTDQEPATFLELPPSRFLVVV